MQRAPVKAPVLGPPRRKPAKKPAKKPHPYAAPHTREARRYSGAPEALYIEAAAAHPLGTQAELAALAGCTLAEARCWRRDPVVAERISRARLDAVLSLRLDAARVRREILADTLAARGAGDLRTSLSGWQLLGKDMGLWPDRLTIEATRALPDAQLLDVLEEAIRVQRATLAGFTPPPALATPAEPVQPSGEQTPTPEALPDTGRHVKEQPA